MQFSNSLRLALFATVLFGCSQVLASKEPHSVQYQPHNLLSTGGTALSTRELEEYFVAREDLVAPAHHVKAHGAKHTSKKHKHRSHKHSSHKHKKAHKHAKSPEAIASPAITEASTAELPSHPSSTSPIVETRDFDDAFELEARASHTKHAHKRASKGRKHGKSKGKHSPKKGTKSPKRHGRKHAKQTDTTATPSAGAETSVPPSSLTSETTPTAPSTAFARELDFDLESRSTKKSTKHSKTKKSASKKHKKHAKKSGKKSGKKLSKKAGKKSSKKVGKKHGKKTSERVKEATTTTERPSSEMKVSKTPSAVPEEEDQTLDARDWATMSRINRINQLKSTGQAVKNSVGLVNLVKKVFHRKKADPAEAADSPSN